MNGLVVRRTSAFFVLMALLASISVIGAPGALAHHPEVSASSFCEGYEPVIQFSAESWTTGSKGTNPNIGIYVDGAWQAAGAFSSENGYFFDGTIPAGAWAGRTVTVMARADAPWGNGKAAGDQRSVSVTVAAGCGGQEPPVEEPTTTTLQETPDTTVTEAQPTTTSTVVTSTTVASYLATVSIEVGYCQETSGLSLTPVRIEIEPAGSATLTIQTPNGPIAVDRSTELLMEGGRYLWTAEAAPGYALDGPARGNFRVADCGTPDAMVSVQVGECVFDAEMGSTTDVRVTIAPAGAAAVVIEGPDGDEVITGSGGTVDLAPGSYTWRAVALEGHALVGLTKGSFTVEDCSPTCTAVIGDYVWLDLNPRNGLQDQGEELVSGVVVHLLDAQGNILATTLTDSNGHYEFPDLCDGVYRIRFELPDLAGLVNEAWTSQDGGHSALDSNADADGLTDLITVVDGTNDMSWDAGIVGDAVSPTTVVAPTTTTTVVEITTTTVAPTTSTTVPAVSPTTVAPTTSTTVAPASTSTTVPPVTATTLPFTGFETGATALMGLLSLAGGAALLVAMRRRPTEDGHDSIGGW